MTQIQANPHIAAMAPYPLPDLGDQPPRIALAQNESPYPLSPVAVQAAADVMAMSSRFYSDSDWTDLRAAISEVHGIDSKHVYCGAGSMDLIACLMRAFVGPGDHVLSTQFAYAYFKTATERVNATYLVAPEDGFVVSVDAILTAVTPETKMVCVANPGNPTGTRISTAELHRLRDGLAADVLLVIDEAYGDFADGQDTPTFKMPLSGHTVVLRTFSKVYALAGMRVGWGVFPETMSAEMRKVQDPGNVTCVGQAAAAASMRDQAYMTDVHAKTIASRSAFSVGLSALGFSVPESDTNFVLIPFASEDAASRADAFLRQSGIVLRGMKPYGLQHCLRATVGTDAQMQDVLGTLSSWLEGEKAA